MMRYEGKIYRPPSEAASLIIQITIGCSHNKCSFCSMYKDKKFRVRPLKEVFEDLNLAKNIYSSATRVFLADGDALSLRTEALISILQKIKECFPDNQRVSIYGTAKDILRKSPEDLAKLRNLGLGIIYLGVESGSNSILKEINKDITAEEMIAAGIKVKESGIKLSTTFISGIGGKANWQEHAIESARVITAINPDYVGLLTLMLETGTELYKKVKSGQFQLLSPTETIQETKVILENLEVTNCIFRSNHASNYFPLGGTLPKDKQALLEQIASAIAGNIRLKEEQFRGL